MILALSWLDWQAVSDRPPPEPPCENDERPSDQPNPPLTYSRVRFAFGAPKTWSALAVLDQVAQVHEGDPVGDPVGLLQVVGDDHDRDVGPQLHDQLLDDRGRARVQRRAGLVEQQHLGVDRERARDAEPLLLATREAQRRMGEVVLDLLEQAGAVERLLDERAAAPPATGRREPRSRSP